MGVQLSHCIHVMTIFRWNSSSKQEWIWEPLLVFFMLEISFYCWTLTEFLCSSGGVSFITAIIILSARPMVHRTFPVQDMIKNKTTDFTYQNLDWMRYWYSTDVFRIHLTKPDNVICFTLGQSLVHSVGCGPTPFSAFIYFHLHFHLNAPLPFILWGRKNSRAWFSLSTLLEKFLWKTEIFTGFYGFNGMSNHTFINQIKSLIKV